MGLLAIGTPVTASAQDIEQLQVGHCQQPKTAAPRDPANYFELLGVEPKDDDAAIDAAYRILYQRFGPDNFRTGNAELLQLTERAYEVLSNAELKEIYMKTIGITQDSLEGHQYILS